MSPALEREFDLPPERVLAAVREAADLWGAFWQPEGRDSRLALPVVQGLRRGVQDIRVRAESRPPGARLQLEIESSRIHVHRPAVGVLVMGALGGICVMLWPLFPSLLPLAPAGAVLALVAWLLVVSRLRSKGPEEFLELVASVVEESRGGESGNVPTPRQR